jgi:GntR family transcriptional repressor for pyruvate dehydrogenase complex
MVFNPVSAPRRARLSDAICTQVEALIVDGKLRSGEALPSERDLAQRLKVSRPSLREALLRLEAHGLVRVRRGGGYETADVLAPTLTDPLVHLLHRHARAVEDVLEMRYAFEALCASFAAERANATDVRRIGKAFRASDRRRGPHDPLGDADADAEFHLAIAEASHNTALVHVMRGLYNLLRTSAHRARETLYRQPGNVEFLRDQHRAIYEAIVARDADEARAAAQVHLGFILASVRQMREPVPASQPRKRIGLKSSVRTRDSAPAPLPSQRMHLRSAHPPRMPTAEPEAMPKTKTGTPRSVHQRRKQ